MLKGTSLSHLVVCAFFIKILKGKIRDFKANMTTSLPQKPLLSFCGCFCKQLLANKGLENWFNFQPFQIQRNIL